VDIALAMEGASNRYALHPQDIVPKEVQFVLDWNPPQIIPARDATPTWPTREPPDTARPGLRTASTAGYSRSAAFYDMHLASHLTLERVVYLNTLVSNMESTVDQAIQVAATKRFLPKDSDSLQSAKIIKRRVNTHAWMAHYESGVSETYLMHTAEYCHPIASTLAIHPSSQEWDSVLAWSTEPTVGRWAIADGALRISMNVTKNGSFAQQLVQNEDDGMKAIIKRLASNKFALAVWEMKNLTVGTAQVMEKIVKMGQGHAKFPWKKCATTDCSHRWTGNMPESRGDYDAGFDAISPPWTLPDVPSTYAADSRPTSLRKGLRSASVQSGTTARLSYKEPSLSPSEDGERASGKRRRSDFDSSDDKRPLKKSKADLVGEKDEPYEPPPGTRDDVNAKLFLQQVTK